MSFFSQNAQIMGAVMKASQEAQQQTKSKQQSTKPVQPKPKPKKLDPTPEWFEQKSNEVENHLKHIALMKLQLSKNLKDLKSQNGDHLWIDTDFIEPATETLQASLEQVQDLENRLLVLQLTYQDHL